MHVIFLQNLFISTEGQAIVFFLIMNQRILDIIRNYVVFRFGCLKMLRNGSQQGLCCLQLLDFNKKVNNHQKCVSTVVLFIIEVNLGFVILLGEIVDSVEKVLVKLFNLVSAFVVELLAIIN